MAKVIQIKRVQEDSSVFIDMPDSPDNPCISCGVCCNHYRVSFYHGELTGELGGTVPAELTSKVNDFRVCMNGTGSGGGRCIALRGEIGKSGVGCGIYPHRPSVCRAFPVWMDDGTPNPECQRLRKNVGLPALVANHS
ncbi:zinc/iron-chelating domain-containing protein [Janthinobacterium sp. BJB412]|nr:zinc/iron-chelating domain-containing protein [Janthinobacterium sp. BJB412]